MSFTDRIESAAPLGQFVMLGDSLTQQSHSQKNGFALGAEIQDAYVRRLDVINRGFSGYNTDHILLVLNDILPAPQHAPVKFLTVWFGANDCNPIGSIPQYVPVDRFKFNLGDIISHRAVTAHEPNIILITPPPVDETMLLENGKRDAAGNFEQAREAADVKLYAEAVKEVGIITGVPVVDIWSKFISMAGWDGEGELPGTKALGKSEGLARVLSDGLHLTPEGYQVVWEELSKVLTEKFPEYPPYKMPYVVKVPWEVARGDQYWDTNPGT